MAVAQLFTFDEFLTLLSDFQTPFADPLPQIFGVILICLEIFAIPFLLRMSLSTAFRWASMINGWLVAAAWLKISLWLVLTNSSIYAAGLLGSIPVTPGWWMVLFGFALCLLAGWSSWGLWPGKRH